MSIIIVTIALLTIFIIRPSLVGYSVYKQIKKSNASIEDYGEDLEEMKSKLLVSNANFSSCREFNEKLFTQLEKISDESSECKGELNALNIKLSMSKENYEEIIKNLNEQLKQKEEKIKELENIKTDEFEKLKSETEQEINDLKAQFSLLAQNLANNLCCKAKVDDPNINYYLIENNKILCLREGELEIKC